MTKLTIEKRETFLALLSEGASVKAAAAAAQASRQSFYALKAKDEDFAKAWEDCLEDGTDELEDEAVRRAKAGSDTLLIFLLKGRRPDKYKDRTDHKHSGEVGFRSVWANQATIGKAKAHAVQPEASAP